MESTDNSLDFQHSLNASIFGEQIKYSLFAFLDELPEELVAITSFISAPALALITLLTKVATVVEIVFKGIANIAYGLFIAEGQNADRKIQNGLIQLCISLPAAILDLLFGAPLHMFYNVTGDFLGLLTCPWHSYIGSREEYHEDKLKELMGARNFSVYFDFLLDKANDRNVPNAKLNPLIDRWNAASDAKTLNDINDELQKLITSPQFSQGFSGDFSILLSASCNLPLYGNDQIFFNPEEEVNDSHSQEANDLMQEGEPVVATPLVAGSKNGN